MTLAERIYRRVPTVLVARRNLSRTTARTLLATLGIVIGVVAIASLGVLGTTLQTAAVGSLGDIGDELVVSPNAEADVESLTERDVRDIRRVSGDATVVPVKQSTVTVEYAN
jgi:putative ABC transport system permease protein